MSAPAGGREERTDAGSDTGETTAEETDDSDGQEGIDRSTPRLSAMLATGAAAVAAVAVGLGSTAALGLAIGGVVLVGAGAFRGSRTALLAGGLALLASAVYAGSVGAGPEALLVAVFAAVVAWDVGENGIGVGEQLGREAQTSRVEFVHAGASVVVGTTVAGFSYGVYRAATGGQPVAALVFLLVGAVALASALGT